MHLRLARGSKVTADGVHANMRPGLAILAHLFTELLPVVLGTL